ncbi:circularly permuted type 2 ATP-grasp protein [Vibrio viridaestus]|uniref:Uncharacterized protein n=1 Tax=Vibrio viridaestus TaxID=2487322 RepID=A0A3N9TIF6_9VIBR|nr:circularly permuted type 2 ATP-grasp protein [Vibrio viridaestus]RQW63683.1 hypothetical protein EES38_10600 [Vibrio viridaestus]
MQKPARNTMDGRQGTPSIPTYVKPELAYDEVYDDSRQARAHWQKLLSSLDSLSTDGINDRQRRAQHILRDDGATYDLKSDPLSPSVWSLDVIPNVIEESLWQFMEKGIAQRSQLFDLILKDIYGQRLLIKEGIVPAEIIYNHPGFLRQCCGVMQPHSKQLIFHAVDLIRAPDGQMVVIGDRTQSPSGSGYSLENRTVISRVIPGIFRQNQVRRLSHFFHVMRSTLAELASHRTDTPTIVVLTPGAYSSTYFEHSYLANYLGYPLVQGGDLTVRNGKVWMKSLYGLTQVDVILRRLDDQSCDQVELNSDSLLGVPGLLEVARAGNVVLANALGSGVLETPALLPFLDAISEFLLGEPLMLPSVQTWWCGHTSSLEYVKTNFSTLIIKQIYRTDNQTSIYGGCLSVDEQNELLTKIEKSPELYVAQSYIPGAFSPIWQDDSFKGRPSLLRTFTVADGEQYQVMPGGLTRTAGSEQDYIVCKLSGTLSKDTWVLSDRPDTSHQSLLDRVGNDEAQRSNLPSRVIENLFWFGRYAERAEINIRLLRTVFKQLNGIDPLPDDAKRVLLDALSYQSGCLPGFTNQDINDSAFLNKELVELVTNEKRIGSIKSSLFAMLACGEQVKEMLSADTRIILNELRDHIDDVDLAYKNGLPSIPEESLDNLVTALLALSGLNHESMLRGMDWTFQQIGRRTERAIQTATLLKSTLSQPLPSVSQQQVLESVLLSVEALISFRRRYRTRTHVANGLDLLMVDESNPRSLIYQLNQLKTYLAELPLRSVARPGGLTDESRLLIRALNDVQLADLEVLASSGNDSDIREELNQLMRSTTELLEQFTHKVSDRYFDHTAGPQQLIKSKWKLDI